VYSAFSVGVVLSPTDFSKSNISLGISIPADFIIAFASFSDKVP